MRFETWHPATKGDKKMTCHFAILPVWIGNDFRWLERVKIKWEYDYVEAFFPPCLPYLAWKRIGFVDYSDIT